MLNLNAMLGVAGQHLTKGGGDYERINSYAWINRSHSAVNFVD